MILVVLAVALLAEPLTLDQAFELAIERDERLKANVTQTEQVRRGSERARTLFNPQVSLFAAGTMQNEIEADFGVPQEVQAMFGLSVPPTKSVVQPRFVGRFGAQAGAVYSSQYWSQRDVVRHQVEALLSQGGRLREVVMLEVAQAYFDALRADGRVKIGQAALERARAQKDLAEARIKAGAELKTAALQAELDITRAERQILDADSQRMVAYETLARLCGRSPGTLVQPPQQKGPGDLGAAVEEAVRARRDVQEAMRTVDQTAAEREVARRKLWPTLGIVGQVSATQPSSVFASAVNWSVVATFSVPLYQGGGEYLDIKDRETAIVLARNTIEQRRKQVRDEVTRAFATYHTARQAVTLAERQVAIARENHLLISSQFKAGAVRPTDVTLAQIELTSAEDQVVVATFDRELAATALRAAMGTLAAR